MVNLNTANMSILCELRNWGRKGKLNYFNSIGLENVIINNNVNGLKRKRKENIYYIYIFLATRVTKIRIQDFWSSRHLLVQGSERSELGSLRNK